MGTWAATSVAVLVVAFVALPALSGAAAATATPAVGPLSSGASWAYGGEGWSNNTVIVGNATVTWDAMFGWVVVFNATPEPNNVTLVEEQRTVGISISASYTGSESSLSYRYHGQEVDTAYANLTNASTVYVGGAPVPALGLLNASATVNASIQESVSLSAHGVTRSGALDVNGFAHASVGFAPSLGLVPLNLSGVTLWNSSAVATPSASWNISWSWNDQGYNGTVGSGTGARSGNLSASAPVTLTGMVVPAGHGVLDHKPRVAIVLVIQGPFDVHDGYVLVPHDFDLFGDASHGYDSLELGSAALSSETLFVSPGAGGPQATAADTTFGASDSAVSAMATPTSGPAPAAASSPGATIQGQPMSVPAAQNLAKALTEGPATIAKKLFGGGVVLAVVGVAALVSLATVGVVEWRAYRRRNAGGPIVGGYATSWPNGVPPAAALSPPNPQAPSAAEKNVPDGETKELR